MTRHAYQMDHGATLLADGTTRFRIWAPNVLQIRLKIADGEPQDMVREPGDWFCLTAPAPAGTCYRFVLPCGTWVPDPTSRLQDGDVHDASVVVDPCAYEWQHPWQGRPWTETVIYEAHPGACGGFDGLRALLPHLARTGITALELMPIADFPGQRNWGYDGVLPYAPDVSYGTPDALKTLIDTAHSHGIQVFLDVVYNHFGPDGAYIHVYAQDFFTEDFHTPWGAGIDFRRTVVQEYFVHNALYWLKEYRFDGLRFDALGVIQPQSFLPIMAQRIRAQIEPGRHVHLVMEHENNAADLLRGAYDAQWTDDVHHALHVLLTGETFGYYQDFTDATALLARSLADGFSYQGETSVHSGAPRGEPSGDLPTSCFVVFDQNHDQIGNRAIGDRITATADPDAVRATRAFLLLSPFIPLLFMGDEWGSRRPFQFFTDHLDPGLARQVRDGRKREFGAFFSNHAATHVPDPNDDESFRVSLLDFDETALPAHAAELCRTRHLLALRHAHIVPRLRGAQGRSGSVLAPRAVQGHWQMQDGAALHIALNLGAAAVAFEPVCLPLLYATSAPVADAARQGRLPARSIAVWLHGLAQDHDPSAQGAELHR